MSQASKAGGSLSGEPSLEDLSAAMIRVDQAGEFGARQIYKGQLAVLAGTDSEAAIREMAEQEDAHLAVFDHLIAELTGNLRNIDERFERLVARGRSSLHVRFLLRKGYPGGDRE